MKFVLFVTLIVTGQAPYSYQVEFSSEAQCQNAMQGVIESYGRNFSRVPLNYSILCLPKGPINSN
jgi:hypothetical protein